MVTTKLNKPEDMKRTTLFILMLLIVSCKKDDDFPLPNRCGSAGVVVTASGAYDDIFKANTNRLSSGEVNSTTSYGDTVIWCISNAVLNTDSGNISLKNCIVLKEGSNITVRYRNDNTGINSLLPGPDSTHYYTVNQAIVINNTVEIIASLWKRNGSGRLDVQHEAVSIFVLDKADWSVIYSKTVSSDDAALYGAALLNEGSYTYIYGTRNVIWDKEVLLARVPLGSLTQPWEFFDGHSWTASATFARPVFKNASDYFSVFRHGDRIYMVTNGALFGQEILLNDAPNPESEWRSLRTLYCNSGSDAGLTTINGQVIKKESDDLIVAYSRIVDDLVSLDNKSPEFIRISNWK